MGGRMWRRLVGLSVTGAVVVGVAPVPVGATSGGALVPSLTLVVSPLVGGKVPLDATAVALNVTVTEPMAAGFVTVYPCGERPLASNVNYVAGQTVPNFVIAALDDDGDVCIDTMATTDVIVDIAGYVPAGSPLRLLEQPTRFLDTRDGTGAPLRRVRAGETVPVRVAGSPLVPSVPATASAVVFNATAVSASGSGFVTVFPCGRPIPETSTLNVSAGGIVPNLVTTAVGPGGMVCIYSSVETDLVGDVAAFLPAGASGVTLFDAPKRVVDTRVGVGGPAVPLGSLVQREVSSLAGVPAGATAVIANLTATEGSAAGWLSAFPCGPVPPVSNVNYAAGQNIANHAYVPVVNGRFCLISNQQTHVVVDIAGYVTGAAAFVPMTPDRLYDSREQAKTKCNLGVLRTADGAYQRVQFSPWQIGPVLPIPAGGLMRISRDCREITVVARPLFTFPGEPTSTLTRYDLAGNVIEQLVGVGSDVTYFTDGGVVAFEQATGIVYDASSGLDMFQVPESVRSTMTFSDVSADGSTFVFATKSQHGFLAWPRRVFDEQGNELGSMRPPAAIATDAVGNFPVISPGGNYLAYVSNRACFPGTGACVSAIIVATTDGTIVDRLAALGRESYGTPRWTSDGSLVMTRYGDRAWNGGASDRYTELVAWELFHAPVVVASLAAPGTALPAVMAAR